ncbi:histidine kinase [Gangjinia marincola]|uniref:Histidine kinase n=1 Tax=Gangjinia marincola TaxID=578463 RepID=A0ABN1MF85_9FLAO
MWKKRIRGIQIGEIAIVIAIYLLMASMYRLTIWRSYPDEYRSLDELFNAWAWLDGAGLQYMIMFVGMAVIWTLIFKVFRHWRLAYRLLIHLVTMPLYIVLAWRGYYAICDYFGMGHLGGNGQVWDVYIPGLVYLLQFAAFHAYEYYVSNQRRLRKEIELKNIALKSELSAIKAQLNPHFLYNVFNTINASVPAAMEDTREMIAELSDLFRYQLRASREDVVPLKDELDFVQKYLDLEQKRFEDRLEILVDVPGELLDREVPPMILQPLVENSVKHGISPLVDGGRVTIKVDEKEGRLHFEIKDTGVGVVDKSEVMHTGVGLSNTQKRLEKMYNSGLFLLDNSPQGLIVQFSL